MVLKLLLLFPSLRWKLQTLTPSIHAHKGEGWSWTSLQCLSRATGERGSAGREQAHIFISCVCVQSGRLAVGVGCFCRCTNNVNTQEFMSNTGTVCCHPTARTETETLCLVTMDSATSPNHQQVITRTWNTCSRILSTLTSGMCLEYPLQTCDV